MSSPARADARPNAGAPHAARRLSGRGHALEVVALVVVVLLSVNLLVQVVRGLDAPPRSDFLPFVTGARLLETHPSCLYCIDSQARVQAGVLGYVPTAGFPEPFVNPPLTALLLRPLAGLPLRTGMAVFVLVLLAGLALALRLALRLLPGEWTPRRRLLVAAAGLLSVPAATALVLAQWVPLLVLAAFGAVAALRSRRWVLAGVLLSLLLVKPQTVWLVLPLLVAARSWRVLWGFALGAAGWVVSGVLLVGPGQMLEWPRLVLQRHVSEAHRTVGLPGLLADAVGRDAAAFVTAVVLAVLVVGAAVVMRNRLRGRTDAAVGAGIALSLVCSPHVFPDDLMLMAVPLVLWAPVALLPAVIGALALSAGYELDGWMPLWAEHWTSVAAVAATVGVCSALCGERVPGRAQSRLARSAAHLETG